jgi:hypothetical protein
MLSNNRLFVQCAPVLADTRVKVSMSTPLTIKSGNAAELQLPRIIASNMKEISKPNVEIKDSISAKELTVDSLSRVHINSDKGSNPVMLLKDKKGKVQTVIANAEQMKAPERLIVAIDGSSSNEKAKTGIVHFLKEQKKQIADVFIADPQSSLQELSAESAAKKLENMSFKGGDDNWNLLERATKKARSEHADVLWIHASKHFQDLIGETDGWRTFEARFKSIPVDLPAICENSVSVFEYQTEDGGNQILERIHAAGGNLSAFKSISKGAGVLEDLRAFENGIQTSSFSFGKQQGTFASKINNADVLLLAQKDYLSRLIQQGKRKEAEDYALDHQLSSIYTSALFMHDLPSISEDTAKAIKQQQQAAQAQMNQTQPNWGDATVIQGVNTAGTVRVNNLANLEALLNILANGFEVFGLAYGIPCIAIGLMRFSSPAGTVRLLVGGSSIALGLATPGAINWLVASARDANLFS